MVHAERWQHNWRLVSPPGASRVDLRGAQGSGGELARVRELPSGASVVLGASGPRGARRCAAFAARAGLRIDRQYLAFPSASAPAYLVEDAPASVQAFLASTLVGPPGTGRAALARSALAALRLLGWWRIVRVAAPGRLALGVRT